MDQLELATKPLPMYLSRVVDVPTRLAPTTFEQWWSRVRRASGAAPRHEISVDRGVVSLAPSTLVRPAASSAIEPLRALQGWLRASAARAFPIELELSPWSQDASALGIRYAGRRLPGAGALARYHRVGFDVLDELAGQLTDELARLTTLDDEREQAA